MTVFNFGAPVRDLLIWPDSHQGVGQYALVDANAGGAFVVGVAKPPVPQKEAYINPAGASLPPLPPTTTVEPLTAAPVAALPDGVAASSPTPMPPLITAPSSPAPSTGCALAAPFFRRLAGGAVGSDVRALQELLRCLGHFPAERSSTGHFGPVTEASVTAYQAANGIAPIGIVGPLTRASLNRYVR
jgi:hypothetical protein